MDISNIILLLLPIAIIELGVRIYALVHIVRANNNQERFRFDSVVPWILIVALVNFGWVFYFIFGRLEE